MEAIKYLVTFGDLIMALIMVWVWKNNYRDSNMAIASFILIFLCVASACLIWWG